MFETFVRGLESTWQGKLVVENGKMQHLCVLEVSDNMFYKCTHYFDTDIYYLAVDMNCVNFDFMMATVMLINSVM